MSSKGITPAPQADRQHTLTSRITTGYDGPTSLKELVELAAILARAQGGLVPSAYLDNPDAIVAVSYAARAMDIPLWVALQELYTVDDAVKKKAILIRAQWMRYGIDYDFTVTPTECTGWIRRPGEDRTYEETYTYLDAERMGLPDRNPEWERQPKAMLVARWTTTTANRWTPHIALGMSTDDLSSSPADPDGGGWSTGEEISPDVVSVLEAAGQAVQDGEGVDGLRRLWEANESLLDEWAGEGQQLREVLAEMLAAAAVAGLGGSGGDAPRPAPQEPPADGQEPPVRLPDDPPATQEAEQDGKPLVSVDGVLGCGCQLADVLGGQGHTCLGDGQ
ncbi:hypothetical protein ACIRPQ_28960 [Streptomyces sp. NPDC101213]|uniref:hypothetical protein n=1 Tax=Streptomyces sp. NPDC101213 TaxID=3366130 RepID=UPI0037F61397